MSEPELRRERAREVCSTLAGSEAAGAALARETLARGPLGGVAQYTGAGEIWSRSALSRRDRSLAVIRFLTALGRPVELRFHIAAGLAHGLRPEEIEESFLQLSVYVGVPFGLDGARIAREVFAERFEAGALPEPPAPLALVEPAQRRAQGLDVLQTLLGHLPLDPQQVESRILASQGFLGELVMDWAFGDVWSRPQLSRRDRSFAVISALAALNLKHELEIHLQGAQNHGVTRAEIEEMLVTLALYAGFPRAIDGQIVAHAVFERADRAAQAAAPERAR
jgi:4-carboxymuconolactone decarboxylase